MDAQKRAVKKFACQKCRSLKVKCIQVNGQEKCLKCTKSGHACLAAPAPASITQRPRKKKSRWAELESKLNGLLSQIEAEKQVSEKDGPSPDVIQQVKATTSPQDVGAKESWTYLSSMSSSIAPEIQHNTDLSDGLGPCRIFDLNPYIVENLLQRFRQTQDFFPFVIIPEELRASEMVHDSPFLLLAAITTASRNEPHLQEILAQQIKETLAKRVIVAGENNLDLLQGLLVYLSRFHHHMIPRSQQVYRLLQIAISMIVDRGLDTWTSIHKGTVGAYPRPPLFQVESQSSPVIAIATSRATIGLFYLSSVVSCWLHRPNTLPFNDSVVDRAKALQETPEVGSDRSLLSLIKLQRIIEDSRSIYRVEKSLGAQTRVHLHTERLISDLEEWWNSLPPSNSQPNLFVNRYHSTKTWIYEMGLVYHFGARTALFHEDESNAATLQAQTMIVANLSKCVDSIRDYLDCFRAMDPVLDDSLPLEEWFRFIAAFFMAYKLSVKLTEFPQWNVELARQSIDLERYMTIFVERMRKNSLDGDAMSAGDTVSSGDIYSVLPDILDSARSSFVLARDSPESVDESFRAHVAFDSEEGAIGPQQRGRPHPSPAKQGKCPATSFWRQSEATLVDFGSGLDWLAPSQPAPCAPVATSADFGNYNAEEGMCPISGFSGPIQDQAAFGEELEWYQYSNNYSAMMPEGPPQEQIW